MAYIRRAAEDTIARMSKMFPVLLVTGPRQVEKTTLQKARFAHLVYARPLSATSR